MKSSPENDEFCGSNYARPLTSVCWVVNHIPGDKIVGRGSQCDRKKRLIVRVGQIQRRAGWKDRNAIGGQFGHHIANSLGIKLKAGPRQDFCVFGQNALVVAHLHRSCQCKRQNEGRISFTFQQARHNDVSVEHDFHLR